MPYFTFSPSEKLVGQKVAKVERDGDWITLTFDNGARALVIRVCEEGQNPFHPLHEDEQKRKAAVRC